MRALSVGLLLAVSACTPTRRPDFVDEGLTRIVSGVVRSDKGLPLPYTRVTAVRGGGGCLIETFGETSTDAGGRYRLTVPALEPLMAIVASHADRASQTRELERGESSADFTLARPVDQAGIVSDPRGKALGNVTITVTGGGFARTDQTGHFLLVGIPAGSTELTAEHPDYPPFTIPIVAPVPELKLTLDEGVSLRLAVVSSEDCAPTRGVVIGDGNYALTRLRREEAVELEFRCLSGDAPYFITRTLSPPLPEAARIEIPASRQLRLELVDEAGTPAERVVLLVEPTGSPQVRGGAVVETDEEGAASLGIAEGTQQLRISKFTSGLVARRRWSGEPVMRLVLPAQR